jgi:sugar/nucleoside kinase (ribokinase family)
LEHILSEVKTQLHPSQNGLSPLKTIAGGSVANTIRGLSTSFGVSCGIIGACGDDEQGKLFVNNMEFNHVNLSKMKSKKGPTGQCVCLVDAVGNRTMRPCLSNAVKLQADELTRENFRGCKWLILRYGIFNIDIIHAAVKIAKQEGVFVSLDLASFEMVRNFRAPLIELLESGNIDLCFANEDEAAEVVRGQHETNPEAALEYLGKHCQWAVVTLASNGCIAKHGKETVRVPAVGEAQASDATGAGDLFASGFLYGLLNGLSLEECCKVGSCSGGAVIRSLGGDVTPDNRLWLYKQLQIKGLPVPQISA